MQQIREDPDSCFDGGLLKRKVKINMLVQLFKIYHVAEIGFLYGSLFPP